MHRVDPNPFLAHAYSPMLISDRRHRAWKRCNPSPRGFRPPCPRRGPRSSWYDDRTAASTRADVRYGQVDGVEYAVQHDVDSGDLGVATQPLFAGDLP
jgi:hypothetical protein